MCSARSINYNFSSIAKSMHDIYIKLSTLHRSLKWSIISSYRMHMKNIFLLHKVIKMNEKSGSHCRVFIIIHNFNFKFNPFRLEFFLSTIRWMTVMMNEEKEKYMKNYHFCQIFWWKFFFLNECKLNSWRERKIFIERNAFGGRLQIISHKNYVISCYA